MKFRTFLFLLLLVTTLVACSDDTDGEVIEEDDPINLEAVSKREDLVSEIDASKEQVQEEIEETVEELSTGVRFSGDMTLTEEGIKVDVTSNLPAGVRVELRAFIDPYGGYVVSQVKTSGELIVEEGGIIQGTIPYDNEDFIDRYRNEPIELELEFRPSISAFPIRLENRDELQRFYGEEGENLEGPFVVETHPYDHRDKPTLVAAASVIGPVREGEVFTIEEPVFGDPPADYGDTNVWMEAEIVNIDHRYIYIEGTSNLLYGTMIYGNIKSSEENIHYQNWFSYKAAIERDGTFTMLMEYESLTDEGFIRLYTHPGSSHPRGKVVRETYGEEFEKISGDIVKPRYDGDSEQMIELIIPLNPEFVDTPEDVDITKDGDEMKLILSEEILFEFNKSEITSDGDRVIREVAEWLEEKEYTGILKIYGHTDNQGSDDINQPLSEDRAENVYEALQSHLKNPSAYEFEVKGFGKYEPIASNGTEEGRQRNRRVEILLQVKE